MFIDVKPLIGIIDKEIEELRNQLIQIGNTTYAGSYLFSGFKTDKPLLA